MGIKISNLPTATESQTTDIVPIVQEGTTKKIQQSILFQDINNGIDNLNNDVEDLDNRLEEAISEFSTPLKYKGQVQTFNDLPANPENGDIYSVVDENKNYVWNGTEWIEYSQTIDIDDKIRTTLTTDETSSVEITNIAGVNGKIDITDGDSVQNLLPEEYQEVEYIKSNGNQYINLNRLTNTSGVTNFKIETSIKWDTYTPINDGSQLLGANNGSYVGINSDGKYNCGGVITNSLASLNAFDNIEFNINYSNRNVTYKINDTNGTSTRASTINDNCLMVFGLVVNYNQSSERIGYNCQASIKFLNIYEDNVCIFKLIPCYRKTDNEIGMYDAISNTFFTNAGTGTFIKGNDVDRNYLVSPTYPIEIHNVGDNVNLFDKDNANRIQAYFNTGNTEIKASGVSYCVYIPITGGKTYTVTKKDGKRLNVGTTATTPAVGVALIDNANNQNSSTGLAINGKECTLKTSLTANYLVVQYISTDADTDSETTLRNSIKIVEGSIAYPYSPYNCGNTNIEVSNKNLYVKDNSYSGGNNNAVIYNKIVLSNGNYTFYANNKNWIVVERYNKSGVLIDRIGNTAQTVLVNFEVTDEVGYIECYFSSGISNVDISTYDFTNVMIVKGTYNISNLPTYIEGKSQIITFPFTEGQRLMLGDYLASDGIHHTRKVYTFTGNEDWTKAGTQQTVFYAPDVIADAKLTQNVPLCNYFKGVGNVGSASTMQSQDNNTIALTNGTNGRVYLNSDKFADTTALITFLTNNTVKIEYELAEEIVEPYTDEQEEAYWQLQHCLMYEDYTKVECIDETKCKFEVTYYYNNELNNTYAKRLDEVLFNQYQILRLVFPIGSTYITQTDTNPNIILGFGTWERIKGKVLVGLDEDDTAFDTIGKTGGEKTHYHGLSRGYAKIGLQGDRITQETATGVGTLSVETGRTQALSDVQDVSNWTMNNPAKLAGTTNSANNLQPYEVIGYMWIRRS